MNDCNEIKNLLSDYIDGELSSEDTGRVKQHLAACAECAQSHATLVGILHAFKTAPLHEPPASLWPRIQHAIEQESLRAKRPSIISLREWCAPFLIKKQFVAALAASIVMVVSLVMLTSNTSTLHHAKKNDGAERRIYIYLKEEMFSLAQLEGKRPSVYDGVASAHFETSLEDYFL